MAQTKTITKHKTQLKYPSRYNVVMYNDNYTPMDFVIQLLVEVFNKQLDQAQAITMQIHENGKAVVGTFSKEVAEQKVLESLSLCRHNGHPLKVAAEEV